jgi:hypothetical protein
LLPAGRLAFAGRASNPLDRDERFQLVLTIIPLSCSPDATTLRFRGVPAFAGNLSPITGRVALPRFCG